MITPRRSPGIPVRVDPTFKKLIDDIAEERIRNRKSNRNDMTTPRITRAFLRHPLMPRVKKEMIEWDFMKDESGQFSTFNVFSFIIISFMAVLMFAGLIYSMGLINNVFQQVGLQNEANAGQAGYVNLTHAADVTFVQANNSIQSLRLVALTLIFSLLLGTILMNSLVRIHPAFFFVYVLIVGLAVMLGAPISNAYESIMGSGAFGGLLPSFQGSNWILLHFPLVVCIMGIIGGVFMFINILRTGTEQSLA